MNDIDSARVSVKDSVISVGSTNDILHEMRQLHGEAEKKLRAAVELPLDKASELLQDLGDMEVR